MRINLFCDFAKLTAPPVVVREVRPHPIGARFMCGFRQPALIIIIVLKTCQRSMIVPFPCQVWRFVSSDFLKCICIHKCIYIYIHVCIYIYIYTYIHTCIYRERCERWVAEMSVGPPYEWYDVGDMCVCM